MEGTHEKILVDDGLFLLFCPVPADFTGGGCAVVGRLGLLLPRGSELCSGAGVRGMDIYVDVSSIVSKLYRPPEYEISAVVMIVDPSSDTQQFITHTWHYYYDVQYERRRMYVWDEQQHDWNYIPKFMENGECSANTVLVRPGGEFVWWRCYRMNFYHK